MDVRESIKNLIQEALSSLDLEMSGEIHLERPANSATRGTYFKAG